MSSPSRAFRLGWALPLLLLVATPFPLAAQDVTGALQGTVVSPEGKPEPEVRVSVSGPYLQGSRQTTTDRTGFFQFLLLPPGRYSLEADRVGLQPLDVREIVVELGRTTALGALTVTPQPIEMKPIEVQARPLTIDPVHTTAGGTLAARDYDALPVDRDYKSLIAVLPQVNDSYRGDPLNVAGSTGLENQYYIDGVNVTDTRRADRATSLPHNFVRAVDVKSGGYEAQYGRALGAVVNAVTYSGTNDFEGNVFGFAQLHQLTADPRIAPAVGEAGAVSYDYGARASGPVVRDRLWYSAAVNPRVDEVDKDIAGHGSFPDRTSAVRFAGKLTWRANPTTSLELSAFGDPTVQDQVQQPLAGLSVVTTPDALRARVASGGAATSLRGTWAPSSSFILQSFVAKQWDRYSVKGATTAGQSVAYVDYVEGSIGGGVPWPQEDHRGRTSLALRGALILEQHTLAAGVEYEDARVASTYDASTIYRQDTATWLLDHQAYDGTFHNRSPAAYLQDTWRINERFALNAGLRWSGEYLVGASGRTAQRIADEWQPRAGFSWQPGSRGTERVFGSYGRFYQTLPTSMAVQFFVDYLSTYSYYSVDPRQPGAVADSVFDGSTLEKDYAKQITGLHAENFDEFTLGYERLIGPETRLTVRGIRRDLRSSFQMGFDPSQDQPWVIGTPGKGNFSFLPAPKREYTALEMSAEGTWRRLRYRTSYVLSRNWGNYTGLYNSDFSISNPGQALAFFMPHQAENSTGYLPNDRTHVLKLSTAYEARLGLVTGAVFTFESGAPINDFAAGPFFGPLTPYFLVARGTAGRTPALWNLDLRLTYALPLAGGTRARVQVDVLHVGNPRRAVQVDEVHYLTLDETGAPATPNPSYRHPVAYQPPMAGRVGVQIGF